MYYLHLALEAPGSSSFSKPQRRPPFHFLHLCHTDVALTVALGMRLALQSLLLLLKELALLLHRRWDQMARRLWYIFGFLRSRFLPRHPERRDGICPSVKRRSTKSNPSPATVICASRFPPPLTSITSGDAPLVADESPTIPIAIRGPTVDDTPQGYNSADHSDVGNYMLSGSSPISRSPNIAPHCDEPDSIEEVSSQNRGEPTPNYSATVLPNNSRPPSRSHRPVSPHGEYHLGYRPGSPYSHHSPSESTHHSLPYPNSAEGAASGSHLAPPLPGPPSSVRSTRTPSIASSVSSRVYSAPRPSTPLRTPYPITDPPRRRNRSPSPASTRRRVHGSPLGAPEPHQAVHRIAGSVYRDSHSVTASCRPSAAPPEGKLRTILGISRHEKHRKVEIEDTNENHVLPPVTTDFVG